MRRHSLRGAALITAVLCATPSYAQEAAFDPKAAAAQGGREIARQVKWLGS